MARNAAPTASVLPVVVPVASFELHDSVVSVTLTAHECSYQPSSYLPASKDYFQGRTMPLEGGG